MISIAFSIALICFSKSFTIFPFILLCSLPFIFNLYYSASIKGSSYNAIFCLFVRESLLMEFVVAYLIENTLLSEIVHRNLIFTFYYIIRAHRIENLYFRFSITHGISDKIVSYILYTCVNPVQSFFRNSICMNTIS